MKVFLAILVLVLAGCASGPPLRDYNLAAANVELSATPFFPQERYQCGPAALATVLGAEGVNVSPEDLTPYIYLPERRGSLQVEMVAATRRYGRVPYVLRPKFEDLLAEVASGKPVLVMQNLGIRLLPGWHYAVVIGYDIDTDSLLLRSGTTERQSMNRIRFEGTWSRAENWAMVAVRPNQPPATAQSGDWLRAASAFEELGQPEQAAQAYEAAAHRWPEQPIVWQALANARYALEDLAGAETALRRALDLAPSAAAYNNLAHILQKRGCTTEAATQISLAESMPDAAAFTEVLARTRAVIETSSNRTGAECSPTQSFSNRDVRR